MMFRSIMLSLNRLSRVRNLVHLFGSVWCCFEVIRNELARHAWRVWITWIKVGKIRSGLACSAGVLLVRANVSSSPSLIRPTIFDLELEWTVGVDLSHPYPLLIFDRRPPPRYKFHFSPQLSAAVKIKVAAIIFVKKILSTRSLKLRLFCRLGGNLLFFSVRLSYVLLQHGLAANRFGDEGHISITVLTCVQCKRVGEWSKQWGNLWIIE